MTISYASVSEAAAAIDVPQTSMAADPQIHASLMAASRDVDAHCHRRFYADTTATARVYATACGDFVEVDDFHSTDGLIIATDDQGDGTFSTTWSLTDVQLEPLNGVVAGISGWPYSEIHVIGSRGFPTGRRAMVKVTAKWGWAAVPEPVKAATLAQFSTVYMAPKATFGVAGINEFGPVAIRPLHPVARQLLGVYELTPVTVA